MKRKRSLVVDINNAIFSCNLDEFKRCLKEMCNPNDSIIINAIHDTLDLRAWDTYISDGMCVADIQKEILKIVVEHENFDPFYLFDSPYVKHYGFLGAKAMAAACTLSAPGVVNTLLQSGVNPNECFRKDPCGAYMMFRTLNDENRARCLDLVLEYGLEFDNALGAKLYAGFINRSDTSCIKVLFKYGINEEDCVNLGQLLRISTQEILSLYQRRRHYLPTWTPKMQRRYPQEFHDIAVKGLSLFKRLNERTNAKICPDMRRLLISYVADEWKKK